jgi:hypothetical protein
MLFVMLELVRKNVQNFKEPVDRYWRATVNEALKELHHVRV